jgi:fatty-acyl-CoA synthase
LDANGYLYPVGRLTDMIIIIGDGRDHYAGPIEDVLTSHPAVREAAVVGAPDGRTGEAVHAVADGVRAEELRTWAARRLPVPPATITFVDALPMTPLGKPDKNQLRARLATSPVSLRQSDFC